MASSKRNTVQLNSKQGHHCLSALGQSYNTAETAQMVLNSNQYRSKSIFFLCGEKERQSENLEINTTATQ